MSQDLAAAPAAAPSVGRMTFALFLISVLGLFLELLLIRWIGTEIRIFAYLQNTVLVVCFLGLGMGCWDCRSRSPCATCCCRWLVLVALLALPPTPAALGEISDSAQRVRRTSSSGTTAATTGAGRGPWPGRRAGPDASADGPALGDLRPGRPAARPADGRPPAHDLGVLGQRGRQPGRHLAVRRAAAPATCRRSAWFARRSRCVAAVLRSGPAARSRPGDLGLLAGDRRSACRPGRLRAGRDTRRDWSPYQKLSVRSGRVGTAGHGDERARPRTYIIAVNNTGYQAMIDLRPATVGGRPGAVPAEPARVSASTTCRRCSTRRPSGAGRRGRVGQRRGRRARGTGPSGWSRSRSTRRSSRSAGGYHPERPYADPRVRGGQRRRPLVTSPPATEKFDVIMFGLLDSHTTTAMTNARLDHYVYTPREPAPGPRAARTPAGSMVLSFEAQKPYIADRMAGALERGVRAEAAGVPGAVQRLRAGAGWCS